MSFGCRKAFAATLACLCIGAAVGRDLRVCADPDNLPLSHVNGQGFENRIAQLVADDIGASLRYEWLPLRRGFVRRTVDSGTCDVLIGVPAGFDRVLTTRAYYRSSYVFVEGPGAGGIDRVDDPRLRRLLVGVQLVGNDMAATPAGDALARSGDIENVRGYPIFGVGPASQRLVDAVASGALDAALVWGPQAGYFVQKSNTPLELRVARAPPPPIAFEFDIAMGVRRGDTALRDELDAVLLRRQPDIDAILHAFAVPLLQRQTGPAR